MGEDRRAHWLVDQWRQLLCPGEQNRVMTSGLVRDEVEHFEFDQGQVLVSSPLGVGPRLQEELQKIADDPVLKRRHDELMDRKWMEWRDRKAARKLVG